MPSSFSIAPSWAYLSVLVSFENNHEEEALTEVYFRHLIQQGLRETLGQLSMAVDLDVLYYNQSEKLGLIRIPHDFKDRACAALCLYGEYDAVKQSNMKFLELNLLSRKPVNVVFKSKKKAASQYESIPFLAVSASDSNDKIVVLTVQSHGIYLFNLDSKQCTHSWSVPPGLLFACPSRYLPKSSSSSSGGGDGALSAPSDDDEDEVHHAAATAARRRLERGQEGHVYAIVKTAPGMPLANASKELKMWSITHNDSENNNNNSSSQDDMAVDQDENMVANQSSCSKMFDYPIFQLETLPHELCGYLVLMHTTGHVTVLPADLNDVDVCSRSTTTWSPTDNIDNTTSFSNDNDISVLWCKNFMISRHSVALSSKILSIYKQNSTGQLSIRIHLVAIDDDEVSITLLKDFRLDFGNQESPIVASYFAANLDTDKIFIGDNKQLFIFKLSTSSSKTTSIKSLLTIPLHCYDMETPLSISHLEPSYIAITGSVKGGEGSVMTVWDTEFGTLQTSKPITSMLQQNVSGSKSHISVQSSSSTLTGPVVVITEVAIVSGAGSLLDFSVSCGLLPYHGNKVTLLSALGKGVERGASSTFNTVAPVNADSVAVTDLCNPSKSQEEFEASFEAWILSKASCTSAVTLLSSNDTDAAEDVAYVQIEHSHLSALILRILGSDFSKSPSFYPRSALKYLVKSGRLSATIQTTQRSPSTMNGTLYAPSTSLSLVRQVLDRNDMEMLELVLRNVPDIDEADMVAVLKYVSLAGDATSPLLPAIVAERRNALDKFVIPSDCDITTTTTVAAVTTTTTTSASSSLSPAQLFFITRIFSIPRNDHFFVRALREQMNIEHVECMFSWIDECFSMAVSGQKQVLSVEEVKPLSQWWWYAWTEPGAKSKKAKHNNNAVANVSDGNGAARTAFEVVVDAVSLIIDAHLSLLLLTPSLHVRLEALQTKINEYQRVSNLMERLRGCVALFNDASSSQKGPRASAEVAAGMVAPSKKKKQLPPQKPLTKHRQRWNRMVSDLHDGVESYNIEEFVL